MAGPFSTTVKNQVLKTGENGYHPIRKIGTGLAAIGYAVSQDLSVSCKLIASAVIILVFFYRQRLDFLLLLAAMVLMLQAELFNSAIEAVWDSIITDESFKIKVVRDISVAAGLSILLWTVVIIADIWRVIRLFL